MAGTQFSYITTLLEINQTNKQKHQQSWLHSDSRSAAGEHENLWGDLLINRKACTIRWTATANNILFRNGIEIQFLSFSLSPFLSFSRSFSLCVSYIFLLTFWTFIQWKLTDGCVCFTKQNVCIEIYCHWYAWKLIFSFSCIEHQWFQTFFCIHLSATNRKRSLIFLPCSSIAYHLCPLICSFTALQYYLWQPFIWPVN